MANEITVNNDISLFPLNPKMVFLRTKNKKKNKANRILLIYNVSMNHRTTLIKQR